MNHLLAAFLLGALLLLGTQAASADKTVSRDDALKAIDVFEKDPSSPEGFAAGETIKTFAKNSNTIHLSIKVVPWLKSPDASDADTRSILFTAYIAGNLQSQLTTKAGDDVYAGWEQVLATYAQLLHINPAAKISEVDDLKKREAAGTLRAYAAEVQKG